MSDIPAQRSLTRREVFKRAAVAGLSLPALATLVAACGPQAPVAPATIVVAPTVAPAAAVAKRGGGGTVRLLWWQAPTNLNSHLSLATKDVGAIRIYAEPLADFDANAQLVPVLAAEIPSVENGGVARNFTSVTWKLKKGVTWHDGQPFTAADVAFTFKFLSEPSTGCDDARLLPERGGRRSTCG